MKVGKRAINEREKGINYERREEGSGIKKREESEKRQTNKQHCTWDMSVCVRRDNHTNRRYVSLFARSFTSDFKKPLANIQTRIA
jgi:hypothetical protein